MHRVDAVTNSECVPTAQILQTEAACTALNLPAEHSRHEVTAGN